MSTFVKGGGVSTPFGRNEYLRSTDPKPRFDSYTVAASSVPARTIDGTQQKILQPGTVMAKITSGGDAGKIGPFQQDAADGRQTLTNVVGLLDTFLPWQLLERDVEVAVAYQAHAVQAWCTELTTAGGAVPQTLTNTTADAMRGGKKLQITFS
jgi:hypothetical protein